MHSRSIRLRWIVSTGVDEIMPEPTNIEPQTKAKLRELAMALRQAEHLEPETQQSLACLLDELSHELESRGQTTAQTTSLAEAVRQVAHSLHQQHSSES